MPGFLEVVGSDEIRFTREDLAELRKRAAQNGHAVQEIKTLDEGIEAVINALPDDVVEALEKLCSGDEDEGKDGRP